MAKIAFACLTAITVAAAAPALAQTAADPAASVAAPLATPAAPAASVAAPVATPAAPAAPAAPVAEAPVAPPAPAIPTEGIGASVLQVLDKACLPMIQTPGQAPEPFAKQLKLRNTRDGWQVKLGGVNKMTVRLPNSANVSSCEIIVNYDPGQGPAVLNALTAWGAAQPAPLQAVKVAEVVPGFDPTRVYTSTNWVGWSSVARMGLSFTEEKNADGTPVAKNAEQAVVQFSFRAITEQDRTGQ